MPRPKKRKQSILEDDADAGGDIDQLTVNHDYARRFQHNKQRDDLHRLKELQKSGRAGAASSESEDESEDEDGLLPEETEAQIFETLQKIRQRDPLIYQKDVTFFREGAEEGTGKSNKGEKKQKPVYLKDVVAQQLLEGGEEDDEDERVGLKRKGKTYVEEQQEIKNEFLKGVDGAEVSDADEDDLLRVRQGPSDAATSALSNAVAPKDADVMQRLEAYFGKDDALDDGERFLKDYLANRKWVDQDSDRVPTYGEIVDDHPDVSEDEEEVEMQEEFEKAYNFRYEEPGSAHVVGHSRVVEGSVRRPDDARKRARQLKAEREAAEERARKEELKRLKNVKKKELSEKLERIKEMAGSLDGGKLSQLVDLEDDFDPAAYDKQMAEMFGEEYYEGGEEDEELLGVNEDEDWAPEEDDEADLGPVPSVKKGKTAGFKEARLRLGEQDRNREESSADDSENESGEENQEEEELEEDGGVESGGEEGGEDDEERQRAYRVLQEDKLAFEKKMEEYYKLDYEDMVGDLPTRFKYTPVKSNTFGLQTDDILGMDDKELNALVSLKNIAPYRPEEWRLPKWAKAKLRMSRKERKKKALEHHGAVVKRVKKGVKGEEKVVKEGVKEGVREGEKKGAKDDKRWGKEKKGQVEGGVKEDGRELANGKGMKGRDGGETAEKKKRKRETEGKEEGAEDEREAKQGGAEAGEEGGQKTKKRKRRKPKGGAAALGLSESRLQSYGQLTVPGKKS